MLPLFPIFNFFLFLRVCSTEKVILRDRSNQSGSGRYNIGKCVCVCNMRELDKEAARERGVISTMKNTFLCPTYFFPIKNCIEKDFFAWKKVHSLFYHEIKSGRTKICNKNQFIKQGTLNILTKKCFFFLFLFFLQGKKVVKQGKLHHDKTIK